MKILSPKKHRLLQSVALIGVAVVMLYFSFYTEKLSEHQLRERMNQFKPEELVDYFWKTQRLSLMERALSLNDFVKGIQDAPMALAEKHGRIPGVGYKTLFLVKMEASSFSIDGDELLVDEAGIRLRVPLKYVFGNTARDVTGWFNPDHFRNMMEFNEISSYINDLIVRDVISDHPSRLNSYRKLSCCGVVEVDMNDPSWKNIEMIPFIMNENPL